MKLSDILTGFGLLCLGLLTVSAIAGYVFNLFKLISATEFALLEGVRVLGLIIPFLGSIMGFVG